MSDNRKPVEKKGRGLSKASSDDSKEAKKRGRAAANKSPAKDSPKKDDGEAPAKRGRGRPKGGKKAAAAKPEEQLLENTQVKILKEDSTAIVASPRRKGRSHREPDTDTPIKKPEEECEKVILMEDSTAVVESPRKKRSRREKDAENNSPIKKPEEECEKVILMEDSTAVVESPRKSGSHREKDVENNSQIKKPEEECEKVILVEDSTAVVESPRKSRSRREKDAENNSPIKKPEEECEKVILMEDSTAVVESPRKSGSHRKKDAENNSQIKKPEEECEKVIRIEDSTAVVESPRKSGSHREKDAENNSQIKKPEEECEKVILMEDSTVVVESPRKSRSHREKDAENNSPLKKPEEECEKVILMKDFTAVVESPRKSGSHREKDAENNSQIKKPEEECEKVILMKDSTAVVESPRKSGSHREKDAENNSQIKKPEEECEKVILMEDSTAVVESPRKSRSRREKDAENNSQIKKPEEECEQVILIKDSTAVVESPRKSGSRREKDAENNSPIKKPEEECEKVILMEDSTAVVESPRKSGSHREKDAENNSQIKKPEEECEKVILMEDSTAVVESPRKSRSRREKDAENNSQIKKPEEECEQVILMEDSTAVVESPRKSGSRREKDAENNSQIKKPEEECEKVILMEDSTAVVKSPRKSRLRKEPDAENYSPIKKPKEECEKFIKSGSAVVESPKKNKRSREPNTENHSPIKKPEEECEKVILMEDSTAIVESPKKKKSRMEPDTENDSPIKKPAEQCEKVIKSGSEMDNQLTSIEPKKDEHKEEEHSGPDYPGSGDCKSQLDTLPTELPEVGKSDTEAYEKHEIITNIKQSKNICEDSEDKETTSGSSSGQSLDINIPMDPDLVTTNTSIGNLEVVTTSPEMDNQLTSFQPKKDERKEEEHSGPDHPGKACKRQEDILPTELPEVGKSDTEAYEKPETITIFKHTEKICEDSEDKETTSDSSSRQLVDINIQLDPDLVTPNTSKGNLEVVCSTNSVWKPAFSKHYSLYDEVDNQLISFEPSKDEHREEKDSGPDHPGSGDCKSQEDTLPTELPDIGNTDSEAYEKPAIITSIKKRKRLWEDPVDKGTTSLSSSGHPIDINIPMEPGVLPPGSSKDNPQLVTPSPVINITDLITFASKIRGQGKAKELSLIVDNKVEADYHKQTMLSINTKVLVQPQLEELLKGFIIIYDVRSDSTINDSKVSILEESFRRSKFGRIRWVKKENKNSTCPIYLAIEAKGVMLAEGEGTNEKSIRQKLAQAVLSRIAKFSPGIEAKWTYYRDGKGKATDLFENAKSRRHDTYKIIPRVRFNHMTDITGYIDDFADSNSYSEIVFGPDFTNHERSKIKEYVDKKWIYKLTYRTVKDKKPTHVCIYHIRTVKELQRWLEQSPTNERYILMSPGEHPRAGPCDNSVQEVLESDKVKAIADNSTRSKDTGLIRDDDSRAFNRPKGRVKYMTEPEYKSDSSSLIQYPIRNREERYSNERQFRHLDSEPFNRQQQRDTYSPEWDCRSHSSSMTRNSEEEVNLGLNEISVSYIDKELNFPKVSKSVPEPMQFDNMVIFYFLQENNKMVEMKEQVLCDSFARSGVTQKPRFNVRAHPTEQGMSECTLMWKNEILAYAIAKSEHAARKKTAAAVLEHLAETYYTVRANSSYYSYEGYKIKLAKGDQPEVYGVVTREDAPTIKDALKLIDDFFNEDTDCDLVFGTYHDFSIQELTDIIKYAKEKKGLEYLSEDQSHVMLFKQRTAQYWRDKLLAGDTVALEKFSLEPPQPMLKLFEQLQNMLYGPNSETQSSSATSNKHTPLSLTQKKIPPQPIQTSSATSNQLKPLPFPQEKIPPQPIQTSSATSNQLKPLPFPQEKIPPQPIQTSSATSNQLKPLPFPQEKIPQQTLKVDPNQLMPGLTRGQTDDVGSLPQQTDQLWVTTWNVRGVSELNKNLINYELNKKGDIIALQDTKLPTGLVESDNFTWYCSGGPGKTTSRGVAILIRKGAPIHILSTSCFTDCVMSMSGIWKDIRFTVVCCYLPPAHNDHYESIAADIVAKLSEANSTTILLGDFNAHIGSDDQTAEEEPRIGRSLFQKISNDNGVLLKTIACSYNLDFCSTRDFKSQHSLNSVTWQCGNVQSQRDYILMTDLGVLKSVEVEAQWASTLSKQSDHKLVSICLEKSNGTLTEHTPNHTTNTPAEERGMLEVQQNVPIMGGVNQPPAPPAASMSTHSVVNPVIHSVQPGTAAPHTQAVVPTFPPPVMATAPSPMSQFSVPIMGGVNQPPATLAASMSTHSVMNTGMAWPVNPVIHSVQPHTAAPHTQAVAPTFPPPVMAAASSLMSQFSVPGMGGVNQPPPHLTATMSTHSVMNIGMAWPVNPAIHSVPPGTAAPHTQAVAPTFQPPVMATAPSLMSQFSVPGMGGVIQPHAPPAASMSTHSVMNTGMAWPVNPVNTLNAIHSVPPGTAAPHTQAVAPTFQPPVMAAAPSPLSQFYVKKAAPNSATDLAASLPGSAATVGGATRTATVSAPQGLPTGRHMNNEGDVANAKGQDFSKSFFRL